MSTSLLDVARTIRPYLRSLLGEEAGAVDRQLATLLEAAAGGEAVNEQIADILYRSPATADWASQVLADERLRPPELQRVVERSIVPLRATADQSTRRNTSVPSTRTMCGGADPSDSQCPGVQTTT